MLVIFVFGDFIDSVNELGASRLSCCRGCAAGFVTTYALCNIISLLRLMANAIMIIAGLQQYIKRIPAACWKSPEKRLFT